MRKYYYHGTSPGMLQKIMSSGKLKAPVYVSTTPTLALTFSRMRLRWHPDKEVRKTRVVIKLDLTGFRLRPDPDPEAQWGRYKGKLFIVDRDIPSKRIVSVHRRLA